MMDSVYGNKVFIKTSVSASRANGHCHTNQSWDYILITDDEFGKQAYSLLLSAYTTKASVSLIGTDTCPSGASTPIEIVRRVEMK